ncbi:MAG: beta-lactamase class [Sphingomonadales bacterium]|jgi:beta-lactamase class C|nr:beta-lactamase class [Sphingomonadales bacterium]
MIVVAVGPRLVRRAPEPPPGLGISDQELVRIAERQKAPGASVDYATVDRRLQALMRAPNMIGMAVGIVEGGQIRFLKGYGETVAGSGDPITPNTLFRWASVSKGVAADMVALLAHDGKLALVEPVGRYAPSLKLPGGNENRASVADLLSHRLGLFSHANDSKLEDGYDPHLLRSQLAQLNSVCAPGTCWEYQNVAYDAASEIVERVTGEPYEQAVKERLFLPLGMRTASLNRQALVTAPSWARPYAGTKASKPVEVSDSYYRVPAAGGVNSSIKDLAIWMQAQMGLSPSVVPRDVLAAVQEARVATPLELARMRKFRERVRSAGYGLGWRVYDYAGHRVIAHRGGVKGYRSLIMFDPALKSGVVALWNSSTNQPGGIEFEVMDMIYHLEPKDWLGLDQRPTPEQPEPEGANSSVDAGG